MIEDIEKFIKTFFEKLEIQLDNINIIKQEENIFLITLETKESGMLIWSHGKNLDIIQNLLTIYIWKLLQNKVRLNIEINDYRKNKDDKLINFIKSKIDIIKKEWTDIKLPFFSSYDRKKIHSFVSELNNDLIYTKSIWEWNERRLYICKKNKKITIDIDGNDI